MAGRHTTEQPQGSSSEGSSGVAVLQGVCWSVLQIRPACGVAHIRSSGGAAAALCAVCLWVMSWHWTKAQSFHTAAAPAAVTARRLQLVYASTCAFFWGAVEVHISDTAAFVDHCSGLCDQCLVCCCGSYGLCRAYVYLWSGCGMTFGVQPGQHLPDMTACVSKVDRAHQNNDHAVVGHLARCRVPAGVQLCTAGLGWIAAPGCDPAFQALRAACGRCS